MKEHSECNYSRKQK